MTEVILTQIPKEEFKTLIAEAVKSELEKNNSFKQAPQPEYIGRKDAAKILGVSLVTLGEYVKNGIVPSYRLASRVRFKSDEVFASMTHRKYSHK